MCKGEWVGKWILNYSVVWYGLCMCQVGYGAVLIIMSCGSTVPARVIFVGISAWSLFGLNGSTML